MILAHIPAGLVVAQAAAPLVGASRAARTACIAGAVFPDLDLLWWWLVDDMQVHHHRYWVHVPLFWLALAPLLLAPRATRRVAGAFLLGVLSHLLLDTVVGDIAWLEPLSSRFIHLFDIAPRPGVHWLVVFLTHWTVAFELVVIALGARVAWTWLRAHRADRVSRT